MSMRAVSLAPSCIRRLTRPQNAPPVINVLSYSVTRTVFGALAFFTVTGHWILRSRQWQPGHSGEHYGMRSPPQVRVRVGTFVFMFVFAPPVRPSASRHSSSEIAFLIRRFGHRAARQRFSFKYMQHNVTEKWFRVDAIAHLKLPRPRSAHAATSIRLFVSPSIVHRVSCIGRWLPAALVKGERAYVLGLRHYARSIDDADSPVSVTCSKSVPLRQ
ncbi:hypothetical protein DENSPDRAFT_868396 [Dentipellis sp. KUC8613]|nr:hypothetical protein DENSPDRAFT_868396 [Dentipellis sp. KUC8613]